MRHNKNFNHLGRQAGHRKAMLSNMASSLILHKRIETTLAKAKAVRMFVEPLVTKSKEDTTHSRRVVFSYLKQKEAVTELFRTIAPKIAERPGGYTRILKTGFRLGDAAEMCIIEFVDFNEAYTLGITPAAAEAKPKTRRSRKPAAKKTTDAVEEATVVEGEPKKAPAKKAAAPKAPKATAAKTAAPKAAKKTNVGKKMEFPPLRSRGGERVKTGRIKSRALFHKVAPKPATRPKISGGRADNASFRRFLFSEETAHADFMVVAVRPGIGFGAGGDCRKEKIREKSPILDSVQNRARSLYRQTTRNKVKPEN